MHISDDDINQAMAAYLNVGANTYKPSDSASVIEIFGRDKGNLLLVQIDDILNEIDAVKLDWEKYSLDEAVKMTVQRISDKHPYLNESVLSAIGMMCSFGWK